MKRLLALLSALFLAACEGHVDDPATGPYPTAEMTSAPVSAVPSAGNTPKGDYRKVTLPSGRTFIIHVPEDHSKPLPVLLAIHGYRDNAANMFSGTTLYKGDAISIFTVGEGKAWAPAPYAKTTVKEDLAYIDQLIAYAQKHYLTDGRVFAAGFSNGGGLIHVLACQRAATFTGLAAVSAANYDAVDNNCAHDPVPYLDIHGTADGVMKYNGGTRHGAKYESVQEYMRHIAEINKCDPFPERKGRKYTWGNCKEPTIHYKITGGKHTWNGGATDSSGLVPKYWATDTILDFFGINVS